MIEHRQRPLEVGDDAATIGETSVHIARFAPLHLVRLLADGDDLRPSVC